MPPRLSAGVAPEETAADPRLDPARARGRAREASRRSRARSTRARSICCSLERRGCGVPCLLSPKNTLYKVNRLRLTLSLTLTQNRNLKCASASAAGAVGRWCGLARSVGGRRGAGRRATKRGRRRHASFKASASASASALPVGIRSRSHEAVVVGRKSNDSATRVHVRGASSVASRSDFPSLAATSSHACPRAAR